MNKKGLVITLNRKAEIFTKGAGLVERLEKERQLIFLAPDQLLHPEPGLEYLVRLGKLRVSQFLETGSEVTRAVMQAGSVLAVRQEHAHGDNPAADVYSLPDIVLMSLGETELWCLPQGSTDPDH